MLLADSPPPALLLTRSSLKDHRALLKSRCRGVGKWEERGGKAGSLPGQWEGSRGHHPEIACSGMGHDMRARSSRGKTAKPVHR